MALKRADLCKSEKIEQKSVISCLAREGALAENFKEGSVARRGPSSVSSSSKTLRNRFKVQLLKRGFIN